MNTFIPNIDFILSAKCLDTKRLGKQRVEAKQIINILCNRTATTGWRHHPAVLMWQGYENTLKYYHNCMINEWVNRGYKNTMRYENVTTPIIMPYWLNDEFVSKHRANLLRKDYKFYSQFNWAEQYTNYKDTPYIWPVKYDVST